MPPPGFVVGRLWPGVGQLLERFVDLRPDGTATWGGAGPRGLWFVLGRDNLPVQPGPHRLPDLADSDAGLHNVLTAVDFRQVFSRE